MRVTEQGYVTALSPFFLPMNLNDTKYSRFALVREMLQAPEIIGPVNACIINARLLMLFEAGKRIVPLRCFGGEIWYCINNLQR